MSNKRIKYINWTSSRLCFEGHQEGEKKKILANHVSDKAVMSNIYAELIAQ